MTEKNAGVLLQGTSTLNVPYYALR